MAFDRIALDALETTMARQRVTVYDLYGLLGVSPNVDEDGLRDAYDSITKELNQVPSDAINSAYSVLANPFKRAQYDRDRLEYLYRHFSDHASFPPTASIPTPHIKTRDDQIQVYATTLVDRVKDPTEDKKKALNRRLETTRNELDEFNELSGRQRQDWATSGNRVLRMAGNALCEVVVCAEEDLRMLEDELGRIDGTLPAAPTGDGLDGPAGRVTSTGYYGSEIMAMPTGTANNNTAIMPAEGGGGTRPRVLMGKSVPSLPRSPTVRFLPQSASKLGIDGVNKDTPSSEGSQNADGKDRVNDFLLGAARGCIPPSHGPRANNNAAIKKVHHAQPRLITQSSPSSLMEKLRQVAAQEHFDASLPAVATHMGLIDWQRLNGAADIIPAGITSESLLKNNNQAPVSNGDHPTDLTAFNKAYDPTRTHSADTLLPARQQQQQLHQQLHHDGTPIASAAAAYRNSWDPAYSRNLGAYGDLAFGGGGGFHVAQPAARHSATAANTVLFKEVQDRAAALARAAAPGRWVVEGAGLTTYTAAADRGDLSSSEEKKKKKTKRAEDPFS
ncbi:heat shock protein binding [Diaporthe australafricana]|uniref:Heat shock protein binding n=1 Tax=Diaporthe australafricana TaxID=127596 RepID=A0ABR3W8N7_9PEZI